MQDTAWFTSFSTVAKVERNKSISKGNDLRYLHLPLELYGISNGHRNCKSLFQFPPKGSCVQKKEIVVLYICGKPCQFFVMCTYCSDWRHSNI